MANLSIPFGPNSYAVVNDAIGGKSRKIGHNTQAIKLPDGSIQIMYHSSVIAIFFEDNTAWYTMAGWDTATTRQRIHALLPSGVRCGRTNGVTYISSDNAKLVFDTAVRVDLTTGEFAPLSEAVRVPFVLGIAQ